MKETLEKNSMLDEILSRCDEDTLEYIIELQEKVNWLEKENKSLKESIRTMSEVINDGYKW